MFTKRKKKLTPSKNLILEEIIGLTTKNSNGLASNMRSNKCAYIAGCVVVLYNVDLYVQSHLMVYHRTPKPLSCVAMSQDGRFVAAGEAGKQTAVLVWDSGSLALIAELEDHLDGVTCLAFSPDGKYLVSVGGYIYLWDWRNSVSVAKLKASSSCSSVTSVSFSSDAKYIITAGNKHLKFWAIGSPRSSTRLSQVHGKTVNLGPHKRSSFIAMASSFWSDNCSISHEEAGQASFLYALTDTGILCLLDSGLTVKKSVVLKVGKSFALCASRKLIACACNDGIVVLVDAETLVYAGSILQSKSKNSCRKNDITVRRMVSDRGIQPLPSLPDAVACQFSTPEKLVVVYRDHSLSIWDIRKVTEVTRCCVLVSHSLCIWDVRNLCCENMHHPYAACVARGCSGGVSFATCSADGSIRLWDLCLQPDVSVVENKFPGTETVSTACLVSSGVFEREIVEPRLNTQGFRSMAVSSDGKYLAAGDTGGNIHVYDLHTSEYTYFENAHDAEVLSLSFSLSDEKNLTSEDVRDTHFLLASGGRDRIIRFYDVKRKFDLVKSIDDHSAAVTSVQFVCNGSKVLSCSADRSLVFRDITVADKFYQISRYHQVASNGTVYDMAVDPTMKVAVTVGQDKKINTFDIAGGKLIRSFKQDKDLGDPIKVTIDPSCSYLLCSYSNKMICMYDFISGDMVAQSMGHGEVIAGAIFLPDCKHIVSVGGDGCIFVWKVPAPLSSKMVQKIKENCGLLSSTNLPVVPTSFVCYEEDQQCRTLPSASSQKKSTEAKNKGIYQHSPQYASEFKFSISRLPKWAQERVASQHIGPEATISGSKLPDTLQPQVEPNRVDSLNVGQTCGSKASEEKTLYNDSQTSGTCHNNLPERTEATDTNSDQEDSSMLQGSLRFAVDNRWLRVYNVCLDAVNSPQTQDFKKEKKSKLSASLFHDQGDVKRTSENVAVTTSHVKADEQGALAGNVDEKLHSGKTARKGEASTAKVGQDMDVEQKCGHFNKHYGTLSAPHKAERTKSSTKKYSARYFLRRDHVGDSKRLFNTPLKHLGGETSECNNEAPRPVPLEIPEQKILHDSITDAAIKDSRNSPQRLSTATHIPSQNVSDQKKHISRVRDGRDKVMQCREALHCLDAAARNAVQLFSDLESSVPADEISGTHLYEDASEMLPAITEKVSKLSNLVCQSSNDPSSRNRVDVLDFQPLMGEFAESISQKVVDILKKDNLRL